MRDRADSIVQNLLTRRGIKAVQLAVGELVAAEEQVRAQWIELTRETPLENATLHVRVIPAEQQCMTCFEKYHTNARITRCPRCGGLGAKILAGEEFHVESVEEEQ